MILIRNAEAIRDRLIWAIADEDRVGDPVGVVRAVVEEDLLPAIADYDPAHLIQVGMRAVIRDVQDWMSGHSDDESDGLDIAGLKSYLLAALITAGAYEDVTAVNG